MGIMQRNVPLRGYLFPTPPLPKKLGPTTGLGGSPSLPVTATGDGLPSSSSSRETHVLLFGNANITGPMMQGMGPVDSRDVSVPTTALGRVRTSTAACFCVRRKKRPGRKGTGVGG
jgi:hypothetical protein